jgi:hypothetical protein
MIQVRKNLYDLKCGILIQKPGALLMNIISETCISDSFVGATGF